MRIENNELRVFQAVIETNGFNKAAERLHLSQSAVSQSISNLESKLDVPLINRGKSLTLTPAGKRLLEHAVEVLREEQQVIEDLSRIKSGDQQVLNLAINSTISRFYAPQLITKFCQQHKNTQLKIAELPSRNLIYDVLAGKVEVALGPFQKQMDAFTTIALFRENRYLVVSPKHPEFNKVIKGDAKTLRKTSLITSSLDTPEKRPAIARIRDRFQSVWEVSSLEIRIHLVEQGLGVAFVNGKMLSDHPACRDFVAINGVAYGDIERQVGLYYKAGKTLSSGAEEFIQICSDFWGA